MRCAARTALLAAAWSVQSAWATDMLPPHKQPKGGGACASALSCHLNGVCEANLCRCDAAWTGPLCGTLHLLPTAPGRHSGRAWPSAPNTSSWGGNVLEVDGIFHLYVSEMGGSCGLASWQHNSFVRHATALKPDGPYSEGEIVMAAFSHNAQAIRDHAGMIAVFHVGSGNPSPKGFITNCTNGTTPLPTPSRQRQPTEQEGAHGGAVARAPYSVPTSRSPGGPWTLTNLSCTGGPCPGFSNPSPHLRLNGTALLAWRTGSGGEDRSKWGMSIARAPGLFGPYTLLCDTPPCTNWSHPTWVPPAGHNCEDPFLWSDSRGGLHVMNHCYNHGDEGGHAFSEDGVHWHLSDVAPWTDSIHHTDGTNTTHYMRQRPKLLLNARGEPTHLLTGLPLQSVNRPPPWQEWCTGTGMVTPSCDLTETHIQQIYSSSSSSSSTAR